jgi:hypothetical protein
MLQYILKLNIFDEMLLEVNLLWDCNLPENLWTEVVMGSRYLAFLNIYSRVISLQFNVVLI